MKSYITIDGGTTNTRVNLVRDRKIIKAIQISAGAKKGIEDRGYLKKELKKAIDSVVQNYHDPIEKILASGMITSGLGLYNLPHLSVPVGIEELHNGMCEVVLSEITEIPFVFIPGVKIPGGSLARTDMMRGEETELIGMAEKLHSECLYVLPGSHSKLIRTDRQGRISDFVTMLTGEMIAALSKGTILKDAVDLSQAEFEDEYLTQGYCYCRKMGINEALFKIRILNNVLHATPGQVYSFFMGSILQAEIEEIIRSKEKIVILGGKRQIKIGMVKLLNHFCDKKVISVPDATVVAAPAVGAIKIYEYNRKEV